MDNAAFDPDPGIEAGRILARLAGEMIDGQTLAGPGCSEPLIDFNGNKVGKAMVQS